MKITYISEANFLSISFSEQIESKSYQKDGIIYREDSNGRLIGFDILSLSDYLENDSLFAIDSTLLKEAKQKTNLKSDKKMIETALRAFIQ